MQERITITNAHGEELVGILHRHETNNKTIILCHGSRGSKEGSIISGLATSLELEFTVFRFDFSGNGESEGLFEDALYLKEVEDVHSVVKFLEAQGFSILGLAGHSKGATESILFASKYPQTIPFIFPLSPRTKLVATEEMQLYTKEDKQKEIEQQGFFYYGSPQSNFKVTKSQVDEMLSIRSLLDVAKNIVDTVIVFHGTADEVIPFAESELLVSTYQQFELVAIPNADHCFTQEGSKELIAKKIIHTLTQS